MSYLRIRTATNAAHNAKIQMDIRIIWRNGVWQRFDTWKYAVLDSFRTKNEAVHGEVGK